MMTTFALIAMQILISAEAGFVNFVQGTTSVTLHEQVPVGTPIETSARSHIELLLNPGSLLRLGQNSSVILDSVELSNIKIRVVKGEAELESSSLDKHMPIRVRTGNLDSTIMEPGVYKFTGDTAVVFDGRLQSADHTTTAKKGMQMTAVAGKDEVTPMSADYAYDELDFWSQQRSKVLSNANALALYGHSTGSFFPYSAAYPATPFGFYDSGWMYSPFLNGYTFVPAYGYQSFYGYSYYGAPMFVTYSLPPVAALPANSITNRIPQRIPTSSNSQQTSSNSQTTNRAPGPVPTMSTGSSSGGSTGSAPARGGVGRAPSRP